MRVETLWTPAELPGIDLRERTVIVVDVLRASTSILTALAAGARRVIPAATTEEALRIAGALGRPGVRLCGERGGLRIEGFDLGNSPREFNRESVGGHTLVWCTTNGTPVMVAASAAARVGIGCFRNLTAVADFARRGGRPVLIVCAGRQGVVCLEDSLCAGRLAAKLGVDPDDPSLPDGTRAVLTLAGCLGPPDRAFLASTAAGRALEDLGLGEDLGWCATEDVSDAVPELRDGGFVLAGAGEV